MVIKPFAWLYVGLTMFCLASNSLGNNFLSSLNNEEKQWLSQNPEISVAFDGQFPPYSFINDAGELEGFSIDVFDRIENMLQVQFKIHPDTNWKTLYSTAKNGDVDLVATMVQNQERDEWFNFTAPYIFKSLVIVSQASNNRINHRNDLQNKRIALVKSYQYSKKIVNEIQNIKPIYVDDMLDAFNAVSTNKADAAISFLGAGFYYRNKYLLSNLKFAAIYDKTNSPESISVRKNAPLLSSIMNKALASIPENTMLKLREKWLPMEYMNSLKQVVLSPSELQWIEKHPEIRVGVDPEFAPFEYIEEGNYKGMASDYLRLLNQRLQLNMIVQPDLKWHEVIENAKVKKIDVLPAVGKTKNRQEYLNFTFPYLKFHRVIITQDTFPFIYNLSDIKDLRVAVQKNSSHHGYILDNTEIRPISYDTLEQSLLAVSGGKVDAFIGNVASSTYWIRKLNLSNLKVAASVSDETQNLHFAVRKDWPELIGILQKGINSINDQQKQAITDRWLTFRVEPKTDYILIIEIIAISALLIIFILIWNILLKRKVKKHAERLIHNSYHDQLTGLPNQYLMLDRLDQLISNKPDQIIAMLSINIDDFKHINDTFGHRTGDRVLKVITKRIDQSLGKGTILGRLGGDQFLVIHPSLTESTDAAITSKQILAQLKKPLELQGKTFSISGRIGISIYPQDSKKPEELLKNADSATHFTKGSGKGTYSFFTSNLNKLNARKLEIENNISKAFINHEFSVVYQPKVSLKTNQIESFEALLRWNSPEIGQVSPDEFIPVMEQNGMIETVGIFVLNEALKNIYKWNAQFDKNMSMAVNLSPRQFRSEHLINQINMALEQTNTHGGTLELEITEGILLDNNPRIEASFKRLKSMGIRLSLDDFGTGYASMSYLRKFHFDILKIDREFISSILNDKNSLSIVSAMIAMAHSLNMQIVAEGVETQEQFKVLQDLECTLAQGWHLGRPIPSDAIEHLLKKSFDQMA